MIPTHNVPPTTTQAATVSPEPEWILPWLSAAPIRMPSPGFKTKLDSLDQDKRPQLAEVLSSNFRAACFEFYSENALGKVNYAKDRDRGIFVLPDGQPLKGPQDLNLREWATKMHTACCRQLDYGGARRDVTSKDLFEFDEVTTQSRTFSNIPVIGTVVDLWGSIDTHVFESALLCALRMCRRFQAWDPLARLKMLWEVLHVASARGLGQFDFASLVAPMGEPMPNDGLFPGSPGASAP